MLDWVCLQLHWLCVGLALALLILTLYGLLVVAASNPGYLPKQVPPFAKGPPGAPTPATLGVQHLHLMKQAVFFARGDSMHKLKFCETCIG